MYPGISEENAKELAERFSIFVPLNGRFSVSGLNKNNIQIIADALVHLHKKHNHKWKLKSYLDDLGYWNIFLFYK